MNLMLIIKKAFRANRLYRSRIWKISQKTWIYAKHFRYQGVKKTTSNLSQLSEIEIIEYVSCNLDDYYTDEIIELASVVLENEVDLISEENFLPPNIQITDIEYKGLIKVPRENHTMGEIFAKRACHDDSANAITFRQNHPDDSFIFIREQGNIFYLTSA